MVGAVVGAVVRAVVGAVCGGWEEGGGGGGGGVCLCFGREIVNFGGRFALGGKEGKRIKEVGVANMVLAFGFDRRVFQGIVCTRRPFVLYASHDIFTCSSSVLVCNKQRTRPAFVSLFKQSNNQAIKLYFESTPACF